MTHEEVNGSLSPSAVRDIVSHYGALIGVPRLAPHDLRRTCARLARDGGAPLDVVQHCLGHASLVTTERYLGSTESNNAGDYIKIKE